MEKNLAFLPTEQTGPRKNITLRKNSKKHLSLSQMFPHLYYQSWIFNNVRRTVVSMKLPCVTWPFSTCSEDTRKDTSNCSLLRSQKLGNWCTSKCFEERI